MSDGNQRAIREFAVCEHCGSTIYVRIGVWRHGVNDLMECGLIASPIKGTVRPAASAMAAAAGGGQQ